MQLSLSTLLVALLAHHSARAVSLAPRADACADLAKTPSWQLAKTCLDSFPHNADRAASTIDTVKKFAQMYVFYDIAQDSPDKSFQPDYDLPGALEKLDKREYKNDREFQEAISSSFAPLNDAHTGYEPECYRQITYAQPFFPVARVGKDGKTRLFVQGLTAAGSEKYASLLGAEIVSINGEDAVQHVWNWSLTEVGLNKDKMARFNRAVSRMGLAANGQWRPYSGYYMLRGKLPPTPEVSYVIRKDGGETVNVTIPWDVRPPTGFRNSRDFWFRFCASSSMDSTEGGQKKKPVNLPFGMDEDARQEAFPAERTIFLGIQGEHGKEGDVSVIPASAEAPKPAVPTIKLHGDAQAGIRDPLISAPGMAFYTLESDDRVGVLLITTFSFAFPGQQDQFRQGIVDAFDKMKELGVKKLMLDLSNNGGGSGCLASEIVAVITPHLWESFPVVQNQFWKDERLSPLMKKLHDVALEKDATSFNPRWWVNAVTGQNFNGTEMYVPPRSPPRVSAVKNKAPYTQFIRDDCRIKDTNPLLKIKHSFRPRDVAIVSNALCGSACGRVHVHLNELDAVPAVVLGAFKGKPRSASAFPATQVLDTEGVLEEIAELGLAEDEDMPKPLSVQASFRFSVRQSYSRKTKNLPLEFEFLDAEKKLDVDEWNALRPDRVWEQSAVLLEWVPKWNKKVVVPSN